MAIVRKHVKAIIQLRRAKESEWIEVDPILRVGEPALSTDVYKLKIGNGHDHWSEIPYLLQTEYEDFKKSKMTDDEKRESELKQFEEANRLNAIERSNLGVQKLLLQNGIEITDNDTELKETLATIVSEDYDKSMKLANSFISLINKTKDQTAKETTTKLLNETPKPIGGSDSSSSLSKVDLLKKEIEEAIKNKDTLRQTELYGQLYQEEQKAKI